MIHLATVYPASPHVYGQRTKKLYNRERGAQFTLPKHRLVGKSHAVLIPRTSNMVAQPCEVHITHLLFPSRRTVIGPAAQPVPGGVVAGRAAVFASTCCRTRPLLQHGNYMTDDSTKSSCKCGIPKSTRGAKVPLKPVTYMTTNGLRCAWRCGMLRHRGMGSVSDAS